MKKKQTPPQYTAFGDRLRAALHQVGLNDPTEIGCLLAAAQESPERNEIPYAPYVVTAWLNGTTLPEPKVFETLCDLMDDKVDRDALGESYENIIIDPKFHFIPEVVLALRHHLDAQGIFFRQFAERLYQEGYGDKVLNRTNIHYWLNGSVRIPIAVLQVADQIFGLETPVQSLVSINHHRPHDNKTPHEHLIDAEETRSFPQILKSLRLACGLSMIQMSQEIASITRKTVAITTIKSWEETDPNKAQNLPSRQSFPLTDVVTVYGEILANHGFGEWYATHDTHIRRSYKLALDNRLYTYAQSPDSTLIPRVGRDNSL